MDTGAKRVITLREALGEIRQACKDSTASGGRSPFFYFVGSGISYPSVPLAPTLQKECEEVARSLGRCDGPRVDEPAEAYSYWFKAAFPHRIQRQTYLRSLIEDVPITHANFRLAHLLLETTVSNIVVTPNFDDLLSRALSLFGKPHILCDDPRIVDRVDPEKSDIQIIHVHGSYWFYDCRNTNDEISDRARPLADTTLTMAALLDKILAYRSPLVIGYSGWESDVFMTALRRRLVTSLPFNLYWFCFRKSEIERLPQFLLNHPDVYFVAPNEQSADGSETSNSKHPDPVLSAVEVLDSFIEQLDVETPRLTRNPLEFFADQLRHSLPKEDTGAGNDIYSLRSVVQRVERANERHIATTLTIERQMEDVREALRRASYDEAAAKASEISSEDLPEDQLTELLGTMETVVRKMSADSPAKASACDVILGCYSLLRKRKLSQDNHAQIAAYATNVKANAFYAAKRYAEAIEIYDAALSQFGDFANSAIQDALGHVRNNKGLSLRNLDRNEEAIAMHEEVIKRFSGTEDNQRLNILTLAHLYKAHAFTNLNRNEEALREFDAADETINRIKDLLDYAKTAIDLSKPVRSKAAAAVVVTPAEQQQTETDLVSTSDDE